MDSSNPIIAGVGLADAPHKSLLCPQCGGDLRRIAFSTAPPASKALLPHLGEPIAPPTVATARGPPLWELAVASVPEWGDTPHPAPACAFDPRPHRSLPGPAPTQGRPSCRSCGGRALLRDPPPAAVPRLASTDPALAGHLTPTPDAWSRPDARIRHPLWPPDRTARCG